MSDAVSMTRTVGWSGLLAIVAVVSAVAFSSYLFGTSASLFACALSTLALTVAFAASRIVFLCRGPAFIGLFILAVFLCMLDIASKWPGVRNALAPALLLLGWQMLSCIGTRRYFLLAGGFLIVSLYVIVSPAVIAMLSPGGLTAETVFLIRQSNPDEALGWLAFSGQWVYVLALLLILAVIVYLLRTASTRFGYKAAIPGLCLYALGVGFLYPGSHAQAFVEFSRAYDENIVQWRLALAGRASQLESGAINKISRCCQKHIVVIGESLSKRYMSAYGFQVDTTPFLLALAKDEAVMFDDVISPEVTTQEALPLDLTLAEVRGKTRPQQTPSIIQLLQGAGFHVSWLSNQNRMGQYDTPVTAIAEAADEKHFMSEAVGEILRAQPDAVLLDPLERMLNRPGNQVVFVHLMGQHIIYKNRYPANYSAPAISGQLNGDLADYAMAIRYGDDMLERIVAIARKSGVNSVTFFADHGEAVGLGHSRAIMEAAKPMRWELVEVPLMIWLSRDSDSALKARLAAGRSQPFMLDDLPQLLLDLYGIGGAAIDRSSSPINAAFVRRPRYVGGGSMLYFRDQQNVH